MHFFRARLSFSQPKENREQPPSSNADSSSVHCIYFKIVFLFHSQKKKREQQPPPNADSSSVHFFQHCVSFSKRPLGALPPRTQLIKLGSFLVSGGIGLDQVPTPFVLGCGFACHTCCPLLEWRGLETEFESMTKAADFRRWKQKHRQTRQVVYLLPLGVQFICHLIMHTHAKERTTENADYWALPWRLIPVRKCDDGRLLVTNYQGISAVAGYRTRTRT